MKYRRSFTARIFLTLTSLFILLNGCDSQSIPVKRGQFINHGIALKSISTFAGIFTAEKNDDVFYGVTRSGDYCRLYRYNIQHNKVDLVVPISESKGSWAIIEDGKYLYIGTYLPAALYRFDKSLQVLVKVASFGGEQYVWNIAKNAEGSILIGTSPNAKVYKYKPSDGSSEELGSFSHERYVRSIESYKGKIYAGIGAKAQLVEYVESTGDMTDILPSEYATDNMVYSLDRLGTKLFIGLIPSNRIVMFDLESRKFDLLMSDAVSDEGITIPSFLPEIRHFSGFGDYLFEYNSQLNTLKRLLPKHSLMPLAGCIIVADKFVSGVTRDAIYVKIAFDGRILAKQSLVRAGLEPSPATPTCMSAFNNIVFLAERQMRRYDTESGEDEYRFTHGEPKAMCSLGMTLFTAHYTGAMLWKWEMNRWDDPGKMVWNIEDEQNRPVSICCFEHSVLIATEPDYGRYGGALSHYSINGKKQTIRNIVKNHTIFVIGVDRQDSRFAYLGTASSGGSGTSILAENAHIVKYDLVQQRIVFDIVPMVNNKSITSIEFVDGFVYAVMENGALYCIDAESGMTIIRQGDIALKRILLSVDGNIYGITNSAFLKVDPKTLSSRVIKRFPKLSLITEDHLANTIYLVAGHELWAYQ